MFRKLVWKLAVPLALVATAAMAGPDDGMEGVPFAFGASVAEVQKALDISAPPQSLPKAATTLPGDAVLRHAVLGIQVFFRKSGHMYLVRFDPPFAGSIGGMKLGDARAAVVQKLGNPVRRLQGPYDRSEAYLYHISPKLSARFDFDATDNVERIMVFPADGMSSIK